MLTTWLLRTIDDGCENVATPMNVAKMMPFYRHRVIFWLSTVTSSQRPFFEKERFSLPSKPTHRRQRIFRENVRSSLILAIVRSIINVAVVRALNLKSNADPGSIVAGI